MRLKTRKDKTGKGITDGLECFHEGSGIRFEKGTIRYRFDKYGPQGIIGIA